MKVFMILFVLAAVAYAVPIDDEDGDDFADQEFDVNDVEADPRPRRCRSCEHRGYHPVCGSDGKPHRNRCELRYKACTTGQRITVVRNHGLC